MRHCHISNHLRIDCPCGCGGCECVHQFDDYEMPQVPLTITVPGGYNDTPEYRYKKNFEPGLDEYRTARKHGLQPKSTSKGAVEQMEKDIESQQRGVDKIKANGDDVSALRVMPGVEK